MKSADEPAAAKVDPRSERPGTQRQCRHRLVRALRTERKAGGGLHSPRTAAKTARSISTTPRRARSWLTPSRGCNIRPAAAARPGPSDFGSRTTPGIRSPASVPKRRMLTSYQEVYYALGSAQIRRTTCTRSARSFPRIAEDGALDEFAGRPLRSCRESRQRRWRRVRALPDSDWMSVSKLSPTVRTSRNSRISRPSRANGRSSRGSRTKSKGCVTSSSGTIYLLSVQGRSARGKVLRAAVGGRRPPAFQC